LIKKDDDVEIFVSSYLDSVNRTPLPKKTIKTENNSSPPSSMEATKPKIVSSNAFPFLLNETEDIKPLKYSTPSKKRNLDWKLWYQDKLPIIVIHKMLPKTI
jgi:hypothetical protein